MKEKQKKRIFFSIDVEDGIYKYVLERHMNKRLGDTWGFGPI